MEEEEEKKKKMEMEEEEEKKKKMEMEEEEEKKKKMEMKEEEENKKKMEMEEEEEKKKKMEMEEEEELLSAPFEEVSPRPGYLASTTASTQRQMPALVYTKKEKQSTKPVSAEEIANTEVSTEISSDGGGPGATTTTTATTVTPESDKSIIGTVTSDDDDDDYGDDASMESSENQSDIMGLDPDSMMASRKFSVQQQQKHLQIVMPAAVATAENAYSYSRTSTPGLNGNNVLLQQADDAAAGQQIHRKSTYNYGSMSMLSPTAMYRQSMQQLREITQQRERSFLQEKSMYNSRGCHRYKCSSSSSSSLSVCCSYVAVAGIGFLVICALLGLIALLIYVILRPQLPKVGIINVQIRQFNAAGGVGSGGNNAVLNLDMNFVVQCVNPNRRLGIDYLQLSILASFQNTSFPVTKVDPFFQVKRSAKLEVANLQVTNFAMASLDDGSALQTAIALNNIPLHAHIDVKAAVQAGSWQTPSFNINFVCDLMVSPPSSPSTAGQLLGVVCLRTKDKIPLSLLSPVS
jgi:hypothetical protein